MLDIPVQNIVGGLSIIQTHTPNARMVSVYSMLRVPEALIDNFEVEDLEALALLGWHPDTMYDGMYFRSNRDALSDLVNP